MKVRCSKTEYTCVNERNPNGTVRLQGAETKKVGDFKYIGSIVQSTRECRKDACASRLEQVEKSIRCDV